MGHNGHKSWLWGPTRRCLACSYSKGPHPKVYCDTDCRNCWAATATTTVLHTGHSHLCTALRLQLGRGVVCRTSG